MITGIFLNLNPVFIKASDIDLTDTTAHRDAQSYTLPFYEDWFGMSFWLNNWETSPDFWLVSADTGYPAPAAVYQPDIVQNDYSGYLLSNDIDATELTEGIINLEFDIKLSSIDSLGMDSLIVQVWNLSSGEYHTVKRYDTGEGSFDWKHDSLNIKAFSMGQMFRIRFLVGGSSTSDIDYWTLDNIKIYRSCYFEVSCGTYLVDDTCIRYYFEKGNLVAMGKNPNKERFLTGYNIWIARDGGEPQIWMYCDAVYPAFECYDPYCPGQDGEYCFYLEFIFESSSDYCSSMHFAGCEQIIHSKINEKKQDNFIIYPNPASTFINLSSPTRIEYIEVFNSLGVHILTLYPENKNTQIDLSGLQNGFYIIKAKTDTGINIDKVFVIK